MNTGIGTLNSQTLARMWNTRPVRSDADGTVGGVCSGIARRYRVDPTLVKVAFVVAALFGGSGVILYVLGWLVLPGAEDHEGLSRREQRDRARAARDEYRRSRRTGRGPHRGDHSHPPTIVLVVILLIVLTSLTPNVAWGTGGLLGAALMLLGWWLLYQRCPDPHPGTSADTIGTTPMVATETFTRWMPRAWADTVTTATTTGTSTSSAAQSTSTGTPTRVDLVKGAGDTTAPIDGSPATPPAWDPLGVAPFAWDLPEPSSPPPVYPESRRRRSPLTPVTMGLALLVAAGATTAAFAGVDVFTPTRIAAMALAVISVGLLVGVRTRRGSGLAPVAVVLLLGIIGASLLHQGDFFPGGGVGEREWRPVSENDIAGEYEHSVGQATLDLRSVTLTANRSVRIRGGVGETRILAPRGMNLDTRCRVVVGEATCPSGVDGGDDGASGPVLRLDVSNILGQVEVSRG